MRLFLAVPLLLLGAAPQDRLGPLDGANLIDAHVSAGWTREGLRPAPSADDPEFLRRVHLDILGVIPSLDLVTRFLADKRADRRARLVDELLKDERYGRNWAEIWEALLIGYDYGLKGDTGDALLEWLRTDVFAKNLPYNEMFRRLVSAGGVPQVDGAAAFPWRFLRGGGGAPELTTRVSRLFLGAQIQCAQCHDHPWDRWTQEDFHGVAAFFVRVRQRKLKPEDPRDKGVEIFDAPNGESQFGEGRSRRAVPPRFLDGELPGKNEPRRAAFARLASRPENPRFARALVNRYWGHFFGRGLVHPVEELNERNRPSHPELLDALAAGFVRSGHDLKWLIRAVVTSRAYQLSSRRPRGVHAPAPHHFSYALTRAMSPEELFNSLIEASGSEERLRAAAKRSGGGRTVEAVKREILRQFRFTFGDDENSDMVEFHGTIPQALLMLNGELVQRSLLERDQRLDLILRSETDPARRLELIFLSVLGRPPAGRERQRYGAHVAKLLDDRAAYEDVFWTLLNSSEFLFSH